ncbi:MAG: RNA-processing protein [Methanolinea sp.]|nr:RNA-processing protein [Methanolinea sp.]
MPLFWFGETSGERCVPCQSRDPEVLSRRLEEIRVEMTHFTPLRWEMAVDCGFVSTRQEYLGLLQKVCILRADQEISRNSQVPDRELIQMVRMLDQIDEAVNLLTERAVEWYAVLNPVFSRKYRKLQGKSAMDLLGKGDSAALREVAEEVERIHKLRDSLAREISGLAETVLPNCTALAGGLVAARLASDAGSLAALSRMPASAIQVLGARTALFSHLRTGSSPPKHGIIYQHSRVHNAKRGHRGRVARTLAAKLAIAARIDWFRGTTDPAFLEVAQDAVNRAGGNS